MHLRQFNKAGVEAFRRFLEACRENPKEPVPVDLLESHEHTVLTSKQIVVEPREFSSRRQAADYFQDLLSPIPPDAVRKDAGIWTWLSLFYFDQICPTGNGNRKVRNDYTYIYMPDESRYFYRHLLFIAWQVKQVAPECNRLFLDSSLVTLDKLTTEVFKRLYLTRIPCLFELLDRLYWDCSNNRPAKGIVSPHKISAGDLVHRFPTRIRQLEKTYDLQSLDADQLLEILGDEFRQRAATSQSQMELSMQ
ncbi:hypothetical protein Pla52o_27800 [Novipirellula galeiformis]|uniref:Uncharacterized protein n=1 Tax=Novipirellula galeiformis TaxID=2528004 RepID=A0A5C6CIC8_9BACT|nr:hypothetical protein [Novipirellula galeiformis]TWU23244.1 hypothetical protein Pla52o_27800 [Novipirellula galeiformis]